MHSDLIVVGGGATGASLVCAARGLSITLVSATRPANDRVATEEYDSRVYALSPGSVSFLRSINVWESIPAHRLTPVRSMRVYGDSEGARIEFDAYRAGVSELAWIVEDRELQAGLWRAMHTQDALEIVPPARCAALRIDQAAHLTLEDGRQLEAKLIVGADGADSFVRQAAGIVASGKKYAQAAVVANFACERPHDCRALQWFQGGPVLALLPLPGNHVSMVWSLPEPHASRLIGLAPEALAEEVSMASRRTLGALKIVSPPQLFPLRHLTAERMVLPRLALVGDAAHVIHPLAGQGLNLGLQDAHALGEVLVTREPVRDAGDVRMLRRYERGRGEAILAMRTAVHGLYSLFNAEGAAAHRLRNSGLNLTDRFAVLKNTLLRHALY